MAGNIWSSYPTFQILKRRRKGCINVPQDATVSVEVRRQGGDNWGRRGATINDNCVELICTDYEKGQYEPIIKIECSGLGRNCKSKLLL